MNLIKDIRIFFPFAGSAAPPGPAGRAGGENTHERASERDETVDEILMNGPSNPE